jgi:hypothetical protein
MSTYIQANIWQACTFKAFEETGKSKERVKNVKFYVQLGLIY